MSHANITFNAFLDGYKLLGLVQADLPTVSAVTAEIKGAGIAGPIDMPILGLTQAMSMTLNFRTVTPDAYMILDQKALHIELWAAVQTQDGSTGANKAVSHKIITRAMPKNLTPGKLSTGETQDRTVEFEVTYYKESYDGKAVLEVDKLNNVYKVNGNDLLSAVRAAIGAD